MTKKLCSENMHSLLTVASAQEREEATQVIMSLITCIVCVF
jgi:hypothetical protein